MGRCCTGGGDRAGIASTHRWRVPRHRVNPSRALFGNGHKHGFRAKFYHQYRLFFRFHG